MSTGRIKYFCLKTSCQSAWQIDKLPHECCTTSPHLNLLFCSTPKTSLNGSCSPFLVHILLDILESMNMFRLLSPLIQIIPRPFPQTTRDENKKVIGCVHRYNIDDETHSRRPCSNFSSRFRFLNCSRRSHSLSKPSAPPHLSHATFST